jgi:hypothetical protein
LPTLFAEESDEAIALPVYSQEGGEPIKKVEPAAANAISEVGTDA